MTEARFSVCQVTISDGGVLPNVNAKLIPKDEAPEQARPAKASKPKAKSVASPTEEGAEAAQANGGGEQMEEIGVALGKGQDRDSAAEEEGWGEK